MKMTAVMEPVHRRISLGIAGLVVGCLLGACAHGLPSALPKVPLYGNWCGPGYPKEYATAKPPIDWVDEACMRHDDCYDKKGYLNCGCDQTFRGELEVGFGRHGRTARDYPFMRGFIKDLPDRLKLVNTYFELPHCKGRGPAPAVRQQGPVDAGRQEPASAEPSPRREPPSVRDRAREAELELDKTVR